MKLDGHSMLALIESGEIKAFKEIRDDFGQVSKQKLHIKDLNIGENSVNVTLGNHLLEKSKTNKTPFIFDDQGKKISYVDPFIQESVAYIPVKKTQITPEDQGFILYPGKVYLGYAQERFECSPLMLNEKLNPLTKSDIALYHEDPTGNGVAKNIFKSRLVPMIEGRSTTGRLGFTNHITAGFGDVGFKGNFTLEIVNLDETPILLRPGMEIGQVFFDLATEPLSKYDRGTAYDGAYSSNHNGKAVPPVLGRDRFFKKK